MLVYLGQGVLILKAMLIVILLSVVLFYGSKLTRGNGLCVGSITAAKGLYSSQSRDGAWSEINKHRSDIVTCYRIMDE